MRTWLSILLTSSGLLSCAPSSQLPPATPPVGSPDRGSGSTPAEAIVADSERVTAAGVKYVAPAGWTLHARDKLVILSAQEGDAHLAIFDSTDPEPDRAVAEAWRAYGAKSMPPLRLALDRPAREGWDQIRQYVYDLPPNEKRVMVADARRHGSQWAALLVDAAIATLDKRGAQFGLLSESIRPSAYTRESFAGKRANALDPGRLANGAFALVDPLQVLISKTSWAAPVSHDPVTISFTQHISADEPLRTGTYTRSLTFTLSTTTP